MNRLYLVVIPVNLVVAFLNLFIYRDLFASLLISLVLAFFTLSFFQSRAGRFALSRWLAILPAIFILDILTCTYGKTAGGSISFLLIGVASVVLFEKRMDRLILLGLLAGSFIFTEWYISIYGIDVSEADVYGIFPPLTFTANFFIMVMVLLYFEEFLQRSHHETQELLEDIKSQNEALTQTNYELAHFANTASHHFQSPLRNISSMLSLMDRNMPKHVTKSARIYMDLIKGDTKQLYQFVEDILMYARVGQGDAWKKRGSAQLRDVVMSAAQEANLETNQVTLNANITLPVHPDHLNMIFVNLFDNAVKYSQTKPAIDISVSPLSPDPGEPVTIAVSDNGIGIDPLYQEQIFEMFSRLHTNDQIPGSGIGLAVCKRVMKEYDGGIELTKSDERGSIFSLSFPHAS